MKLELAKTDLRMHHKKFKRMLSNGASKLELTQLTRRIATSKKELDIMSDIVHEELKKLETQRNKAAWHVVEGLTYASSCYKRTSRKNTN